MSTAGSLVSIFCVAILVVVLVAALALKAGEARPDIVFADFESPTYGDWKTTGTAFGNGPAEGALPGQMHVSGFLGKRLVNSFHGGDKSVGTLTSPPFKIERKTISFLMGGGGYEGKTRMNLLIDGKIVRTAVGPNIVPGGSEALGPHGWDVAEFEGKTATIQMVDDATGGWGHITVDQIVFTDAKAPAPLLKNATNQITASAHYLFFPIKSGALARKVAILVDGQVESEFTMELADGEAGWWAPLDISHWTGKTLTVRVDRLPADSRALALIDQGESLKDPYNVYHEPLRPQIHFSAKRGWLNDPNGLVYFDHTYHLFFQHNPYGWAWGNMHWGHATSNDLIHWHDHGDVLAPDALGPMFSGSAVVDWKNTSGFGKDGKPPIVLIYTAAGKPTVQCIAYSDDGGRTFAKYANNPVVQQISPGNRDPKVMWHEPSKSWVMALFVGLPEDKKTIHFLTSPNLKDWTVQSHIDGFYECPDLFELPLDSKMDQKKWVLTAASSEYMVGSFDGKTFVPETEKLKGQQGRGYYAAQTYSDLPSDQGRRVQIGWMQAASHGMAFNQCMSVPLELGLMSTRGGPRLSWNPAPELWKLTEKVVTPATSPKSLDLKSGGANPLADISGESLAVYARFQIPKSGQVSFDVRGVPVVYDADKDDLSVNNVHAHVERWGSEMDVRIIVDRTTLEVFALSGTVFMPMPVVCKSENRGLSISTTAESVTFITLEARSLQSIWKPAVQDAR